VLAILLVFTKPHRLFQSRRQKALTLLVASLGMVLFFSRPYVRGEVVQRAESIYAPKTKDEASGAGRTSPRSCFCELPGSTRCFCRTETRATTSSPTTPTWGPPPSSASPVCSCSSG
jgi:hypothetical protein